MFKSKDTMMRGGRGLCRGSLLDLALLAIFITLAYVYTHRRSYMSKVDVALNDNPGHQHPGYRNLQEGHHPLQPPQPQEQSRHDGPNKAPHAPPVPGAGTLRDPLKIDDRIKKIPDVRSQECKSRSFKASSMPVSIITTFFDYQFYDLKATIDTVRLHTPETLIKEIIMVDDGSTLDYIKNDARIYAQKITNGRLVRLDQREGGGKSRVRGAHESIGEYLVFLDSNTLVTSGWLEPLLDILSREQSTIAVPHYDNVNDPVSYEYIQTNPNLITVFTWSLTMRMYQNPDVKTTTEPLQTPVLRGNAFALHKQLFGELGSFDEDMRDFGAENLEFSFRSWMCGAKLKIIPCSRVGVLNLYNPVKVSRSANIRRISEVWLTSRREFVYKSTNTNKNEMSQYEEQVIQTRKGILQGKSCRTLDWYLENIAVGVYTPSQGAVVYGLLKSRSGRCARVGNDSRIDLGNCKPEKYQLHPTDMLFELTDSKMLKIKNQCLIAKSSAYVVTGTCNTTDTKHQWAYESVHGELTNVWSGYCAMHVTDPDKKVPQGRQIFMVQECKLDKDGAFTKWDFISP